jgi:hypothetical protein
LDTGISAIEICSLCFGLRPPVVYVTKPKRLFICEYCHRIFITNNRMIDHWLWTLEEKGLIPEISLRGLIIETKFYNLLTTQLPILKLVYSVFILNIIFLFPCNSVCGLNAVFPRQDSVCVSTFPHSTYMPVTS